MGGPQFDPEDIRNMEAHPHWFADDVIDPKFSPIVDRNGTLYGHDIEGSTLPGINIGNVAMKPWEFSELPKFPAESKAFDEFEMQFVEKTGMQRFLGKLPWFK